MKERLQKIIASAGIASRRSAENMIMDGRVSVNHVVVRQLGTKADVEKDEIRVDGKLIFPNVLKIYIMLNKPMGYVTTLNDPQKRPIVTDLLSDALDRVYPVGRLDYDSEGLLIMTNDGEFAQRIQHPRFRISKTYDIKFDGMLTDYDLKSLSKGIPLDDGEFKPDFFQVIKKNPKSTWLRVTISEGRNRIIRRALLKLGHSVSRLIRIAISDLQLGNLKTGKWRELTKEEVKKLLY